MPFNYQRSFEELELVASKFWPRELSELETNISILPILLETQDRFINILSIDVNCLEDLFVLIDLSNFPSNLFLKHLVILADFGGEMLQRISTEFSSLFQDNSIHYYWREKERTYSFLAVPNQKFNNNNLKISGEELLTSTKLDNLQKDAIALLLFGGMYSGDDPEISNLFAKCQLGEYLGKINELQQFVKQRYIWVSRITGGAKSNNLGQIAQNFVYDYIINNVNFSNLSYLKSGRLPGVTHTDRNTHRNTSFDIVVTNQSKFIAIEVGFQVTTNSVIERKAGQAQSRFEQIKKQGFKIAYVIDGAGNFQREVALRTICSYSHCTVAFSREELDILCRFIREYFEE